MSIEENKRLVRRFYEQVVNDQNVDAADEFLSPDFTDHGATGETNSGIEAFRGFISMATGAFPDLRVEVKDIVAEGDKVVTRIAAQGTHKGVLMEDIQPTGKNVSWTGIDIFEIKDGKVSTRWSERNIFGLMKQLEV